MLINGAMGMTGTPHDANLTVATVILLISLFIVQNMIDINSYIGILITLTIPTGILFELPMLVFLLTKLGILTPDFMRKGRKISYVAILTIVAVITPQGDITSLLLISTPVFVLYELSIGISTRVYKQIVRDEMDG